MGNVLRENFPLRGGYNSFFCFPKSRVSSVVGQGVPALLRWQQLELMGFEKSNQTNLALAGMGNVANPSRVTSKEERIP